MESKERTPSVIARLMGLDELPPQQSCIKQRRVLSENYLKKVGSLGVRNRRSSNVCFSFNMSIEKEKEIEYAIESLEALKKSIVEANPTFLRSQIASTTYSLVDSKHSSIKTQLRDSKDVSARYLQKPELLYTKNLHKLKRVPSNSLSENREGLKISRALDHGAINRFRRSGKILKQGNVGLFPEIDNGLVTVSGGELGHEYLPKFTRSCLDVKENLHSCDNKPEEILNFGTRNRNLFVDIEERRKLAENKVYREAAKEIAEVSKYGDIDASVKESQPLMLPTISDSQKGYKSPSSSPNGLNVAREAKKRISERWKTNRKFQEVGFRPRKLDYSLRNCHLSNQSCCNDGDGNIGTPLGTGLLGPILLASNDDNSSQVQDSSFQQEVISDGFPEEGSASSQCSATDPGSSFVSSEEAYQRSPDSVLEMSCSTGCFERDKADLIRMQLELLESDSSEESSEGPGINVSSDEEGSVSCSEENKTLIRSFNVEESRDFSYLVDVLMEAGFYRGNMDAWDFQEYPISPSVFETLEKKYGDQKSWMRSERKLLLDRMNLGLKEILQPCIGVPTWKKKPLTERLNFLQSWDIVEEKLWKMMANEDKEVNKASSNVLGGGLIKEKRSKMLVTQEKEEKIASYEKVLRGDAWLSDLGDDVEDIGKEIERLLVDEIVAEVVISLLSF